MANLGLQILDIVVSTISILSGSLVIWRLIKRQWPRFREGDYEKQELAIPFVLFLVSFIAAWFLSVGETPPEPQSEIPQETSSPTATSTQIMESTEEPTLVPTTTLLPGFHYMPDLLELFYKGTTYAERLSVLGPLSDNVHIILKYHDDWPPGTIISQEPAAGSVVDQDTQIYLTRVAYPNPVGPGDPPRPFSAQQSIGSIDFVFFGEPGTHYQAVAEILQDFRQLGPELISIKLFDFDDAQFGDTTSCDFLVECSHSFSVEEGWYYIEVAYVFGDDYRFGNEFAEFELRIVSD